MSTAQNLALDASLQAAERRFGGSRLERLCNQPIKSILPLVERRLGSRRSLIAETLTRMCFSQLKDRLKGLSAWSLQALANPDCDFVGALKDPWNGLYPYSDL